MTATEVRQASEERAVSFLDDTYGDDPFVLAGADRDFSDEEFGTGDDPDSIRSRVLRVEASRSIRTVIHERPNGYPRYLNIGRGMYQRTTAVPIEILTTKLQHGEAVVGGWLKRLEWLGALAEAKTGEKVDVSAVKSAIEDLEAALAA